MMGRNYSFLAFRIGSETWVVKWFVNYIAEPNDFQY